jgi:uncharacterized membrane protein YgdD (TMEM256/DUF423 family)
MSEIILIINLLSLVISIGLGYSAVRLLRIFKGGKMGKPWMYISAGVFAVALASCIFSLRLLLDLSSEFIRPLGGVIMLIGGVLMVIGIHLEYKHWSPAK